MGEGAERPFKTRTGQGGRGKALRGEARANARSDWTEVYANSPLLTLGVPNTHLHAQAAQVHQVICTFTLGAAASGLSAEALK